MNKQIYVEGLVRKAENCMEIAFSTEDKEKRMRYERAAEGFYKAANYFLDKERITEEINYFCVMKSK